MSDNSRRPNRQSTRLVGYDYATPGAYGITVCTHGRAPLFGAVIDAAMHLNDAGRIVERTWREMADHYPGIILDAFVVMPDHIHAIVILTERPDQEARDNDTGGDDSPRGTPSGTLGRIVQHFKSLSTARYARAVRARRFPPFGGRLWQRNYHDHIERHDRDLDRYRAYIATNPLRWTLDED